MWVFVVLPNPVLTTVKTMWVKVANPASSHLVLTSDYCNIVLAGSPMSTTNRLQRVLNAALVSSVVPGSSTVVWCTYTRTSLWTALDRRSCNYVYVSSISLEWPSTSVFKAGCPSTSWIAAHLLPMSPAISVFAVPAAISWSFQDIIAASLLIGRFLLSAQWPETICLTISWPNA